MSTFGTVNIREDIKVALECGDLSPLLLAHSNANQSGDRSPHSKEVALGATQFEQRNFRWATVSNWQDHSSQTSGDINLCVALATEPF